MTDRRHAMAQGPAWGTAERAVADAAGAADGPWLPMCEAEPIHAPGAIQPFGAMLLAREGPGLVVSHASSNLEAILGRPAADVLGRPLGSLFGFATVAGLLSAPIGEAPSPGVVEPAALAWAPPGRLAIAGHRIGDLICIEIEPDPAPDERVLGDAPFAIQTLRAARDLSSLCATAATELRRLTGFERAMVYRFDATGHGEVVAEALAPGLEAYLGLRYPASDIPRQARRLYLRQRLRVIGDVEAMPVPLLALPGAAPAPDIGLSVLRAASPIHLEYMHNMGVRSTLVVSLLVDGALWGMLVCHDRQARHVTPALRLRCDLLGQVASLMVATLRDADRRAEAARRRGHVAAIAGRMAAARHGLAGLCQALARDPADLLGIADATGAVVRLGGRLVLVGQTPPAAQATALLDALLPEAPETGEPLADAAAGRRTAALSGSTADDAPAGVLLLPIARAPGDGILWLRPALTRVVRWGGDPGAAAQPDPETGRYAPRRSFAAWQEEVRGQAEPWSDSDFLGIQALRREIDQALVRHAEAEWGRLRHHDPLTGLPNRNLLRDCIDGWCAERHAAGLLLIGLDRFKGLNDSLGEAAGDALLRQVAARLVRFARPPARLAARLGGDEFALFCPDLDAEGLAALAGEVGAHLAEPCHAGGRALRLSTSIGIAALTGDAPAQPAQELLARADLALLAAKRAGGNRRVAYDARLRAGATRRIEIEQELRAALEGGEPAAGRFHLIYQPTFALGGKAATPQRQGLPLRGFEALLRWDHPTLGEVPPTEFIPVAEECGLIGAIGDWVLDAALRQIAAWRALDRRARGSHATSAPWRVAVNVSPLQLSRPGFAADVLAQLDRHGVPPQCLAIEVTEGVFADQAATAVIAALRAGGLHIAVDDFGIGYSSLSYLRRLPVDELKLDRSFLQRQDGGPRHEEFLAALVTLARAAGLGVLAEGVETEAHLAAVAAAGCDAVQGWLFAPGLPPDRAADWLLRAAPVPRPTGLPPLPQVSFREIVDCTQEAVLITDADLEAPGPNIVYCNAAFTRLGGWPLVELIGRSPRLLQGPATDHAALRAMVAELRAGRPAEARVINYTRSGMPFRVELRASPLRDQDGRITHFVALQRDISHDPPRVPGAEPAAERDPLTGLANRRGLARFVASLGSVGRQELCVAALALDGLGEARSRHGAPVGDALLLGVADLLAGNMRRADLVGRVDGDGFVICMPGLRPTEARAVAERLCRALARARLPTPVGPLRVDGRIGLAALQPEEEAIDAAIDRAAAVLGAVRPAKRSRVVVAPA